MRPDTGRTAPRRSKIIAGALLAGLVTSIVLVSSPASAQSVDDKRAEAQRVASELDALNSRLMDLSAQAERSRYELSKVETQVSEAQARAEATREELTRRRAELRSFAVRAYVGGTEGPEVTALFSADGDDAAQAKVYVEVTAGKRRDLLDGLRAAEKQAEDDAEHLRAVQAEAARATSEIESARSGMEQAAASQRAVNSRVQGELATLVQQESARRAAEQRATAATAPAARSNSSARPPSGGSSGSGQEPTGAPGPLRSGLGGAIDAALSKVGSSYSLGSSGPDSFDCSGLLVYAFGQVGISLPHYSGAMYGMTRRISRGDLQPGDLVFWGGGGSEHVALYMGGNQLVHSFGSGGGVNTTQLDGWWKTPSGYGRL